MKKQNKAKPSSGKKTKAVNAATSRAKDSRTRKTGTRSGHTDKGGQARRNGRASAAARSVKSPLNYYGGKHYHRRQIIPLFPQHHTFVDVFGGGASILLGKQPSPVEVYNDIDSRVHNFFSVVGDPGLCQQLVQRTELAPYSRKLFNECIARCEFGLIADPVEAAWALLVCCNQGRNGVGRKPSDFSYSKAMSRRNMSGRTSAWRNLPRVIAEAGDRLQQAIIENLPWNEVMKRYDSEATLFYLDPPYLAETRKAKKVYRLEMSHLDHVRLLLAAREVQGKVILSGYDSDPYDQLLPGWTRSEFDAAARAGKKAANGKLPRRTEVLWMNYAPPVGVAA